MTYTFDFLGVAPVLTAFEYQHQAAQNPNHSKAYLSSSLCTLDSFIKSTELLPSRPNWNWEEVVSRMINFWLKHEERVHYWQQQLTTAGEDNVLLARVASVERLRDEFELLL